MTWRQALFAAVLALSVALAIEGALLWRVLSPRKEWS